MADSVAVGLEEAGSCLDADMGGVQAFRDALAERMSAACGMHPSDFADNEGNWDSQLQSGLFDEHANDGVVLFDDSDVSFLSKDARVAASSIARLDAASAAAGQGALGATRGAPP